MHTLLNYFKSWVVVSGFLLASPLHAQVETTRIGLLISAQCLPVGVVEDKTPTVYGYLQWRLLAIDFHKEDKNDQLLIKTLQQSSLWRLQHHCNITVPVPEGRTVAQLVHGNPRYQFYPASAQALVYQANYDLEHDAQLHAAKNPEMTLLQMIGSGSINGVTFLGANKSDTSRGLDGLSLYHRLIDLKYVDAKKISAEDLPGIMTDPGAFMRDLFTKFFGPHLFPASQQAVAESLFATAASSTNPQLISEIDVDTRRQDVTLGQYAAFLNLSEVDKTMAANQQPRWFTQLLPMLPAPLQQKETTWLVAPWQSATQAIINIPQAAAKAFCDLRERDVVAQCRPGNKNQPDQFDCGFRCVSVFDAVK